MEYNDHNLLYLYSRGLSYSDIAGKLGVTRCKVAGKLYRLRHKKAIVARQQGINPSGKKQDYSKRKVAIAYRPKKFTGPNKAVIRDLLANLVAQRELENI